MSLETVRVGIVEDDALMGESLVQRLELEGFDVDWWRSGEEALSGLSRGERPDLMVCDIRLPGISGESLYRTVSEGAEHPPFIFITAFGDIDQAVRLMRAGAEDYLSKPFRMDEFLDRIERLVPPRSADADPYDLGPSQQMRSIAGLLDRLAESRCPVLFTGETGVGKEVCARYLHDRSGADAPFVAVNCAAIPADLMESELFGHQRGAFTGAGKTHRGYAERAGSGTLFLDEIGELSVGLQAKLLRLIEERCFHRVGGESLIPFQGRIVSATNRPLDDAVSSGAFRSDLYYRVNTVSIDIPPLKERTDDVLWLANRFAADPDLSGSAMPVSLSAAAEDALVAHDWPGNARELRNRIARATALSARKRVLAAEDLFPELTADSASGEDFRSLGEARDMAEKRQIERALETADGQIAAAAKLLKISRTTLWQKMRRLGIASRIGSTGLDS